MNFNKMQLKFICNIFLEARRLFHGKKSLKRKISSKEEIKVKNIRIALEISTWEIEGSLIFFISCVCFSSISCNICNLHWDPCSTEVDTVTRNSHFERVDCNLIKSKGRDHDQGTWRAPVGLSKRWNAEREWLSDVKKKP